MTTILVGAEGLAEIEKEDWWRYATPAEMDAFLETEFPAVRAWPHELLIDGIGRPYFLVVLFDHAPDEAKTRATAYRRVKRLIGR